VKEDYGEGFEDANVVNFVLDRKTYRAIEDPEDGYRSSLRTLCLTKHKVANRFTPIEVLGIYEERSRYGSSANVIQFYDAQNGKLVLEVGTDNSDDYYPSFVGSFTPENMHINEGKTDAASDSTTRATRKPE
jgi:hypothetical protein